MGRVEFYAFHSATAAWKRLITAPTAAQVWALQKFFSAVLQLISNSLGWDQACLLLKCLHAFWRSCILQNKDQTNPERVSILLDQTVSLYKIFKKKDRVQKSSSHVWMNMNNWEAEKNVKFVAEQKYFFFWGPCKRTQTVAHRCLLRRRRSSRCSEACVLRP